MRADVNIASDTAQPNLQLVAQVDERLQLTRVASEPVEMPGKDGADPASPQVVGVLLT